MHFNLNRPAVSHLVLSACLEVFVTNVVCSLERFAELDFTVLEERLHHYLVPKEHLVMLKDYLMKVLANSVHPGSFAVV